MSRLIQAAQRLKAATDALEQVAAQAPIQASAAAPAEVDRDLRAALEAAQRQNQTLSEAADDASGRLDRAIRRIQSLLEG